MDQEQQELHNALTTLMEARRRPAEGDSCEPFVSVTAEFGIRCGASPSNLFALHHLLDVLGKESLFVGERRPNTTLEAMQYIFPEGDTAVYDNVTANRTEAAITLTIHPERRHEDVMTALKAGAAAAQREEQKRKEDHLREQERLVALFAKETSSPVFGAEQDNIFVKKYLIAKTNGYFGDEAGATISGPHCVESHMPSFFSQYDIVDDRPKYVLAFYELDEHEASYNKSAQFKITLLPDVFECPFAVTIPSRQPDLRGGRVRLEVRGNASRLVRDIIKYDRKYALQVAKDMGLTLMHFKTPAATNNSGGSRPHAYLPPIKGHHRRRRSRGYAFRPT